MGNSVICRLARRLALMAALAAAATIVMMSPSGAVALLDSRAATTVTAVA